MIDATRAALDDVALHGERIYPEECCGFLLGSAGVEHNTVRKVLRVDNSRTEDRRRRYLIGPEHYLQADRTARAEGLDIVGIYHSHPDHPAIPSATDLAEATFPGFSYLIVSVREGVAGEITAWRLVPDRSKFVEDEIRTRAEQDVAGAADDRWP